MIQRTDGPLDMVDRALGALGDAGGRTLGRAFGGGAALVGAGLLVYYVEQVEGVRTLRPVLALILVLSFWARAYLTGCAARAFVLDALEGVVLPSALVLSERPAVLEVARTASVVGIGFFVWSWLLVGASFLGVFAVLSVLPFFAFRGAVAPSWLARATVTPGGGAGTFSASMRDTRGVRFNGLVVELLLIGIGCGLTLNLMVLVIVLLALARSMLGVDTSTWAAFVSTDNTAFLLLVASLAFILLEPVRAAVSALFFVDARARDEGLDLEGFIDRAVEHPGANGTAKRAQDSRPATATAVLLLVFVSLAFLEAVSGNAHAQQQTWAPRNPPSGATDSAELRASRRDGAPREGALGREDVSAIGAEVGDTTARKEAESILARAEFREFADDRGRGLRELIERFLRGLFPDFDQPAEAPNLGGAIPVPSPMVLIVLLGVLIVFFMAVVLRLSIGRRRISLDEADDGQDEASSEVPSPETHLDRASRLAAEGRFREALRELYRATLVALDRRRVIELEPGKTNWEYIRAMGPGPLRDDFRSFTRLFDHKWYGEEATTEGEYLEGRAISDRLCRSPEQTS